MNTRGHPRGFTVVELLVVLGIFIILLAIFIPYVLSIREESNRSRCANNLRLIRNALQAYAQDNDRNYPSVRYDIANRPQGYTAYSGTEDPDPFAAESAVQPNDVTASLWLLVRRGLIADTVMFVCPSTNDYRDRLADSVGRTVDAARRGNFRSPANLSYSYASPFSDAAGYRLNSDWLNSSFALMADKNPGTRGGDDDVTAPAYDADEMALARANSNNHAGAGQNVLYPGGNVEFVRTPYSGVGYAGGRGRDNIYTARARGSTTQPTQVPVEAKGFCGQGYSPAAPDDSYLIPTDDDVVPSPLVRPTTLATPTAVPSTTTAPSSTTSSTTSPTTAATTLPATTSGS